MSHSKEDSSAKNNNLQALIDACLTGNNETKVGEILENLSSDTLNKQDEDGRLPIHYAISGKSLQIVRLVACKTSFESLLSADEAEWNVFHVAASVCSTEIVSFLMCEVGFSREQITQLLGQRSSTGSIPLHYAASKKAPVSCVELLLSGFPDAIYVADSQGNTPLHRAASAGSLELCRAFLNTWKAPINKQNNAGCTPLMLAVEDRDETLIKLLVDEGADVFTIKNAESETANEMALRLLQKSLK